MHLVKFRRQWKIAKENISVPSLYLLGNCEILKATFNSGNSLAVGLAVATASLLG